MTETVAVVETASQDEESAEINAQEACCANKTAQKHKTTLLTATTSRAGNPGPSEIKSLSKLRGSNNNSG